MGGNGGAYIFTQDQGDGGVERDSTGCSEGNGDTEHRRAALDDHSHQATDGDAAEDTQQRLGIEGQHQVHEAFVAAQRLESAAHDLETEKNQAEGDQHFGARRDPIIF